MDLETAKEALAQFMEMNKMRKTLERYAILETVYRLDKHVSADELHEIMKPDFMVSRATVYNTLEMLYRAKIVMRHQFGSAVVYERWTNKTHYHTICTICGTVSEFQNTTLKNSLSTIKLRGFSIAGHDLHVYGTCTKCRQRIGRQKKNLLKNNDKKMNV